jgi:hypothetical protein
VLLSHRGGTVSGDGAAQQEGGFDSRHRRLEWIDQGRLDRVIKAYQQAIAAAIELNTHHVPTSLP